MTDGDLLRVSDRIAVPMREIELRYVRSSGPGGQNVNKVASKAMLRFNLRGSRALPDAARDRALARLASRLTRDGALVLSSGTYRDQARNRDAVLARLQRMLADAIRAPIRRRPTAPSAASRERRLTGKRVRSERKRARQRPAWE
jgi:ribosome-associated protein